MAFDILIRTSISIHQCFRFVRLPIFTLSFSVLFTMFCWTDSWVRKKAVRHFCINFNRNNQSIGYGDSIADRKLQFSSNCRATLFEAPQAPRQTFFDADAVVRHVCKCFTSSLANHQLTIACVYGGVFVGYFWFVLEVRVIEETGHRSPDLQRQAESQID